MAETQRGQRRSFRQALVGGHFKLGTVPANPSPDANAWPFPTADSSLFYTSADFSRPSLPGPPLPIPGPRRQVPQDQQLAASAETPALRLAWTEFITFHHFSTLPLHQ